MTIKKQLFAGTTVGGAWANAGGTGDDAFTAGTDAGAGAAIATYQSSAAASSARLVRLNGVSADQFRRYWSFTQDSQFRMATYITLTSAPSFLVAWWWLIEGTSFTQRPQIELTTGSKLQLKDGANVVKWTSTTTLANATRYRVEVYGGLDPTPTTTNGVITVKLFSGESTTALETYTSAAFNLGTVGFIRQQFGKNSTGGTLAMDMDTLRGEIGTSAAPLGPYSSNTAPVATAPAARSVDSGEATTLTGTDSDAEGNITTREWLYSGSVIGTGSSVTVTMPYVLADTVRTYTYRVTDSGGLVGTSTVDVTVLRTAWRIKKPDGSFAPAALRRVL